jgi:hypothetical protein
MTINELTILTEMTSNRITIIGSGDPDNINVEPAVLKSLVDRIETESSYYLSIYKRTGQVLWRGVQKTNGVLAYESRSVTDREPMTSDNFLTMKFDQALRELGFQAVRSNSIFATGDYEFAGGYGYPYIIIPKNTAKFTWSEKVDDLIINPGTFKSITDGSMSYEIDLNKFERVFEYTDGDFAGAVSSGHEVLISGEYFAIHWALWSKLIDLELLPEILDQRSVM